MGCWNHTCAITNLPIHEGDEVEVIMLQFRHVIAGSSLCYPYYYHIPLPLTFHGTYNDYGGVENCEGIALDVIVDSIRDNLFEMEVGENTSHDIAVKKEDFDVKHMFEIDHEDRLNIVNPYKGYMDEPEKTMIKHIVIRKEVYDKLVEGVQIDWWNRKTHESTDVGLSFIMNNCHGITADIDEILALDDDDFKRVAWRMLPRTIGVDTLAGEMLQCSGEYRGADHPICMQELLMKLREDSDDRYDGILENALRFSILRYFMSDARKSWVLPTGLGSQNDNTKSQRLCAELTLASAEIIDHMWDEE